MRRWSLISLTIALFLVPSAPLHCQETNGTPPASSASPKSETEVLTLEQAIATALANNRQIKIFDQNVLISNDEILAARTQRYPHFSVDVTGSGLLTPVTIKFPKGAFGFDGKTLIHPSQLAPCNEVFAPSAAEVDAARKIIAAFDLPENKGKGATALDGRMVERLHAEIAQQTVAMADAIAALA